MGAVRMMLRITAWALLFFFASCALGQAQNTVDQHPHSFIALSDIHFDPFISCTKKSKSCPLIDALVAAPASKWKAILQADDHSLIKHSQDTNTALLMTVLDQLRHVSSDASPEFVMVLGDMLGHHYRRLFRRYSKDKSNRAYYVFVRKTLTFLTQELARASMGRPIYFVVGNNDSYTGDYSMMPNQAFFKEVGSLWSSYSNMGLAEKSMMKQFSYAGYYSATVQSSAPLTLIVLNTTLFSTKARGQYIVDAANAQLSWLRKQLNEANRKGDAVFILMHIPEGVDFYLTKHERLLRLWALWKDQYIKRYNDILSSYLNRVSAVYSGHLHTEWSGGTSIGDHHAAYIGVPSISPFFGHDPSFNLLFCDEKWDACDVATTYRYSLGKNARWFVE